MKEIERIAGKIVVLRNCKVILDSDLAGLYGVETRVLSQAVRRNAARFPLDFVFSLTKQEVAILRSQIVISSWGGRRSAPRAFTEHGAIMAATVLNSPRAIEMSLYVVRAFVQLREALAANKAVGKRLDELEQKFGSHDHAITELFTALRRLMQPSDPPRRRRIGFV